jgi:tripartite ATP-independent transporter DctP family solute receptor
MRLVRHSGHAACALGALALFALACAPETGPRILRLGHGLDPSHPVHRAMQEMARLTAERSRGNLHIEIYPSEQLGSERESLELLQIGSLAMTKVSAAVMENFAPGYRVLGLPYLFRDEAHRFAVLDGEVGRGLLLESERYRLRGLAFYDAGSRSFYTRDRPIRRPEDLRGLKIRTQESPSAMEMVRLLGAAATPIAWGELYTALQQGVVDGAENNAPSFHLSGHYEVARYYTLDEHTGVPDVLLIGSSAWSQLDAQQKRWLAASARDSVAIQRRLWKEARAEALRAVAADGVEIIRPDKQLFSEPVAAQIEAARRDPQLGPLLEAIEHTRAEQKEAGS